MIPVVLDWLFSFSCITPISFSPSPSSSLMLGSPGSNKELKSIFSP
uniref:Uncharacterized protein n=1 Tax=Arundo donax TaxID=35708 RepID=A0A0A9BJR4_ARUDO